MKRFVSLQVQDDRLMNVDPYELTTWLPIGPNTPLSLITDNAQDKNYTNAFITLSSGYTGLGEDYTQSVSAHRKEISKPTESRRDYLYLERLIERRDNENTVNLRSPKVSFIHEVKANTIGLLRVDSPVFIGEKRPQLASPSASDDNIIVPTKKVLEIKKPKSGIFINEPEIKQTEFNLNMDPREVQKYINQKSNAKFTINQDGLGNKYAKLVKTPVKKPTTARSTQIMLDSKTIIRGTTCLESICSEPSLKWSAFAISVAAFAYSKLVEPQNWSSSTIDDVLHIGNTFSETFPKNSENLPIENVSTKIDIRGIRVEIDKEPTVLTGQVSMLFNYVCSDLYRCLKDIFTDKRPKGVIVEFNEAVYAVWFKKNTFFLFDPYSRDEYGKRITTTEEHQPGFAFVMINNQLQEICQTIYDNVVNATPMAFELHLIWTLRVDKVMYEHEEPIIKNESTQKTRIISSKTSAPLPNHEVLSSVPANELSILSVSGRRKKKTTPQREGDEIPILDIPQAVADDQTLVETKLTMLSDTLDVVLDKIQDKIAKKCKQNPIDNRARSILIKSDLGVLQQLKRNILRGECDKKCDSIERMEPTIKDTCNSHFRVMPDQSEVMLGSRNILQVVEYNESIGVVAPVIAVVLANKYSVETWEPICLDYILSTTRYVQECVPMNKYSMFQTRRHHLPDLQIGSQRYSITVDCILTGSLNNIGPLLSKVFQTDGRLVISSLIFNVSVMKRGKYFYLFDAFPCDLVGFRSNTESGGMASLQRFRSVASLANRIKCNAVVARMDQHCSVNKVVVKNVTGSAGLVQSFRFSPLPEWKENETIEKLNQEESERVERNEKMLNELNSLIKEEKCRIKKFNKRAGIIKTDANSKGTDMLRKTANPTKNTEENSPIVDTETKNDETKLTIYDDVLSQPYGYACVIPGFVPKIQGTAYLPNRFCFRANGIRACHFCSMYAACMAAEMGCYWDRWNFSLVDLCIEEGRTIYANLNSLLHLDKRVIDRVLIKKSFYKVILDKYNGDICKYRKKKMSRYYHYSDEQNFINKLDKFFNKNRYGLIQFPNITFAVIRQESYNIFDPYASNDLREGEVPLSLTQDPPIDYPMYKDNHSASWISIPSLQLLVKYIKQRIRYRDIHVNSEFFTIKCVESSLTYRNNFAQFMLNYSFRRDTPQMTLDESSKSMRNEEMSWVRNYPFVFPWSRQHSKNTMQLLRYTPKTMWKSFDVEVDGVLYSLWANLHPMCAVFHPTYRGKQFYGIYAIAGCIAAMYPPEEWTQQLMNYIVVEGDLYFNRKMSIIPDSDYAVALSDIVGKAELASFAARISVEHITCGTLYSTRDNSLNLKNALLLFFREPNRDFGVLQCDGRSLAFGRTKKGNFFMLDCMCIGRPVFMPWEGAAYLLLSSSLNHLMYCIVLTLRLLCCNVEFHLHSVLVDLKQDVVGKPEASDG